MVNAHHLSGKVSISAKSSLCVKESKGGAHFIRFSLATVRVIPQRGGEAKKSYTYHRIVVYGNEDYLTKHILPRLVNNASVYVLGETRNSTRNREDGTKDRLSEVVITRDNGLIEFAESEVNAPSHTQELAS